MLLILIPLHFSLLLFSSSKFSTPTIILPLSPKMVRSYCLKSSIVNSSAPAEFCVYIYSDSLPFIQKFGGRHETMPKTVDTIKVLVLLTEAMIEDRPQTRHSSVERFDLDLDRYEERLIWILTILIQLNKNNYKIFQNIFVYSKVNMKIKIILKLKSKPSNCKIKKKKKNLHWPDWLYRLTVIQFDLPGPIRVSKRITQPTA